MQHKKNLGQHFLIDQNIVNKLVRYINPSKKDFIIEIGPGDGAMTKSFVGKVNKLFLIEKDRSLMNELGTIICNNPQYQIIYEDILKYDLTTLNQSVRIVGNLPYNISTEIIFKMCHCKHLIDMHFMLQREVVDRIVAESGSNVYGRLSIMAQAYFKIEKLFNISENVFYPKPKVKSSFIRLLPKKYAFNNKNHENNFYNVVKAAFEGRRKMIKKSLIEYLSEKEFNSMKINPNLRAEDLSVNDYIYISEHAKKI